MVSSFALAAAAVPIARAARVANPRTGVRRAPSFHGSLCSSAPRSLTSVTTGAHRSRCPPLVTAGPEPDTEEEGSALDFPEEYVRAVPSRRPDIFPDLKEPKQPMPKPMPGDPEMPDEEEEEEERKKNPGEPGADPDEEDEENPKPKKKDDDEEEE